MTEGEVEATVDQLRDELWRLLAEQPPTSTVKQVWAAYWQSLALSVPDDCVEVLALAAGALDSEGVWNVMLTRNVLFYGEDGEYIGDMPLTVRAPALGGAQRDLPKLSAELRLDDISAVERTQVIAAFRARLEDDAGWRALLRTRALWQEPQVEGQGPL